jgi:L-2-hydroxyglutarate oxidase LhgO
LWSPSTGIIDSHALMLALQGDLEAAGGRVVTHCPVVSGRVTTNGIELRSGGPAPFEIRADIVINAAGLQAQSTSASIEGVPVHSIPRLYLAKGHYFVLSGKSPFRHLVYPVAVPGGLGVHVTLDLAGQARFGPDVEWLDRIDYDFDAGRRAGFVDAIRRYYPALDEHRLQPAYTGIRPKLTGPGHAAKDFCVTGPRDHGVPGYVALYGIESPGLTACLALASHVADQLA